MKLFRDDASRNRVSWLIVHGVFLAWVGVSLCRACYGLYREDGNAYWQFRDMAGAVAWLIAALAGCGIAIMSVVREFRPFARREDPGPFAKALAYEILLVFLAYMLLDCGFTGSVALFVLLLANLVYLVRPAGGADKQRG